MLVRSWRFATIMLTALSMGVALAHLMELPAKIRLSGEEWHAIRAVLEITALAALVLSVLQETPSEATPREAH